jgi:hypothetical protein
MKAWWLAAISIITVSLLLGCGQGAKVTGTCASGFAVQFRITSVKDSLPLDNLTVKISVGGGDPQDFSVNLKTGVSTAAITAAQGQDYTLDFQLFSSGKEIGKGQSKGTLSCDLDVALDPIWDTVITAQVKKDLKLGVLIPSKLEANFTQAVAGNVFELPLDSLKTSVYRWYLKLDGKTLIEDEGAVVRIPIADSLAGKTLVLRLQVVEKGVIKEDRIWVVIVLAAAPNERIARIKSRSDTTSPLGISLAYRYENGHVTSVETYDSLSPSSDLKPVGVESLYYDDKGRLSHTSTWMPDSSRIDSTFGYDDEGRLASLEVKTGVHTVVDSLAYSGGKLSSSRRSADGALLETAKYVWTGSARRDDSVFTLGPQGRVWSRLIQNTYKNDSLVLRQVAIVRDGLQPLGKEVIAYNAVGGRAYREVYTEGQSATLEQTDAYSYDAKGRLIALRAKDEVAGSLLYALDFEYAAAGPKVTASAIGSAAGAPQNIAFIQALEAIRFTHSGWDLRSQSARIVSGR